MSLKNVTEKIRIEMSGSTQRYMVSAKQGDMATRYVEVTLLDNGEEYQIPVGAVVTSYVRKPDRKKVYNTCQFSGSKVTVALNNQTLAVAGTAMCEVEVQSTDMTQVITSVTFEIEIEPRVKDENAIMSSDEMTMLENMMNDYKEEEKNRVKEEQNRVKAENSRVDAEKDRENSFEKLKDNVNGVIKVAEKTTKDIQEKVNRGDFTGTIKIGTVTTGEAGSEASVRNSGTDKDAVLNMTIPKGDKGDKGEKGDKGDKGEKGDKGDKGETGDIENLDSTPITFEESTKRENIESGDSIPTGFGKIRKWFSSLGQAAFRSVVNGVTKSEAGQAVLDAAVGKYLDEKKLDITRVVANRNITENGFAMDGKTAADWFNELNGNMFSGQRYVFEGSVKDLEPGMYFCTPYVSDLPGEGYYFVDIVSFTPGNTDKIIRAHDPWNGRLYTLCRLNGSWSLWKAVVIEDIS